MLGMLVVLSLIPGCYILFTLGYIKGYSAGIDEVLQNFDKTIEWMVKDDKNNQ
jgi:hypothetical protein